jgi:CHAD domain-containing protein
MNESDPLLRRIQGDWTEVSSAWRKTKRSLNPKSVHDLRVTIRRLSASLSVLHSIIDDDRIVEVQRQFKKVQKRLGPLRDVQVQIASTKRWRRPASIRRFGNSLERFEKREGKRVLKILTGRRRKKLRRLLHRTETRTGSVLMNTSPALVFDKVSAAARTRLEELQKARAQLIASDPSSLHELRISAKKLRYLLESSEPLLGPVSKEQQQLLRNYQSELGAIRDMQVLEGKLREWAQGQDEGISRTVERRCRSLSQRRASRTNKFLETLHSSELLKTPFTELTHDTPLSETLWVAIEEDHS